MTTLHNRIKQHRKKLGLSQSDMAKRCGVSQPTIANWECGGHIPRQEALAKLAECLGVDTVWLLSGEIAANRAPIHDYLSTPIHHIPIYGWTDDAKKFASALPIKFISLSMEAGDTFGVFTDNSHDLTPKTILIFKKQTEITENTQFLARKNGLLKVLHATDIKAIKAIAVARLMLTVIEH